MGREEDLVGSWGVVGLRTFNFNLNNEMMFGLPWIYKKKKETNLIHYKSFAVLFEKML